MERLAFRVRPNLYRDSVALMRLAAALAARPGVARATAIMATPANCATLAAAGLAVPGLDAQPDDLLLVAAGQPEAVETALDWADAELTRAPAMPAAGAAPDRRPGSLAEGVRHLPEANLALISVPGEYAYAEALKAVKLGLHVFLFSDGLALEDEVRLKHMADERRLLLMGPECGTALLAGQPLGFCNAVRPGSIGLVAASGTGLQEVMSLVHQGGGGVSHAIGTGGRDVEAAVGACTMLAGLRLLATDPSTASLVLISKPPAPAVAARVLEAAGAAGKPVVAAFLGLDRTLTLPPNVRLAATLEEAAQLALAGAGLAPLPVGEPALARAEAPRRWVRGLFSGGTLCSEALLILRGALGDVAGPGLGDGRRAGHWCLDLGAEGFTTGRPHPMIDGSLRAEWLQRVAADPETAVVLLDVVLGYGASPNPTASLLPAVARAGEGVRFVAHVCGTDADPQDFGAQVSALRAAGVAVAATNAAAARLAAALPATEVPA